MFKIHVYAKRLIWYELCNYA